MTSSPKFWWALCPLVLLVMIWGAALLLEVAPITAWWCFPALMTLLIVGVAAVSVCTYRALTLWEDTHD